MIKINEIRSRTNQILVIGQHPAIIQSILDFDYLCGKKEPSVIGIIAGENGMAKYFWGKGEVLVPVTSVIPGLTRDPVSFLDSRLHGNDKDNVNFWFLNVLSGRRALSSTRELVTSGISFSGGVYFAENVPEEHSVAIFHEFQQKKMGGIGPSSVGLLVPRALKLGAIGGITPAQILDAKLMEHGAVAVMSASGGMTNELINIVIQSGNTLSFAVSFGGDRFPILTPEEAFLIAEKDTQTKVVVFYGELGGDDEYRLIKLKESGKFTKKAIIHIAGTVADLFVESPQFGHAKAKAEKGKERARSKRDALRKAGFAVTEKLSEIKDFLLNSKYEARIPKQARNHNN